MIEHKDHCSNICQMSAVLSMFPWATDFVMKEVKTILTNEHYLVRLRRPSQPHYPNYYSV